MVIVIVVVVIAVLVIKGAYRLEDQVNAEFDNINKSGGGTHD